MAAELKIPASFPGWLSVYILNGRVCFRSLTGVKNRQVLYLASTIDMVLPCRFAHPATRILLCGAGNRNQPVKVMVTGLMTAPRLLCLAVLVISSCGQRPATLRKIKFSQH